MTGLREPVPSGEISVEDIETRECPSTYSELNYIVHPSSTGGADTRRVVEDTIVERTSNLKNDARVIVIAPPSDYVYLTEDCRPTDIRDESDYESWVKNEDIQKLTGEASVVLTGGMASRCLGALACVLVDKKQNIINANESEINPELNLQLPLDSIYTEWGMDAGSLFSTLKASGFSDIDSIVSIFSEEIPYSTEYRIGNFGIINTRLNTCYEISLNGKLLCKLNRPEQKRESEEKKDNEVGIKVIWIPIEIPKPKPKIKLKLNIVTSQPSTTFKMVDPYFIEHANRMVEKCKKEFVIEEIF